MSAEDYATLLVIYMASGMVVGAVCVGFAYLIRDWLRSHFGRHCVHGEVNDQCGRHYGWR